MNRAPVHLPPASPTRRTASSPNQHRTTSKSPQKLVSEDAVNASLPQDTTSSASSSSAPLSNRSISQFSSVEVRRKLQQERRKEYLQAVRKALDTPPYSRTEEDIAVLYSMTKKLKTFINVESEYLQTELCRVIICEKYPPDSVVFAQGDPGSSWYIVLKGCVAVIVEEEDADSTAADVLARPSTAPHEERLFGGRAPSANKPAAAPPAHLTGVGGASGFDEQSILARVRTGGTKRGGLRENAKVVGILRKGDSFGELALVKEASRAATVFALGAGASGNAAVELLRVDKADYERIIRLTHEREIAAKATFLRQRVAVLQPLSEIARKRLAEVMLPRSFKPGEVVIHKGAQPDGVYLIRSGKCRVIKDIVVDENANELEFEVDLDLIDKADTGGEQRPHQSSRRPVAVATLGPGQLFGEIGVLHNCPRTATVVATGTTPIELYFIARTELLSRINLNTVRALQQQIDNYPSDAQEREAYLQRKRERKWTQYKNKLVRDIRNDQEVARARNLWGFASLFRPSANPMDSWPRIVASAMAAPQKNAEKGKLWPGLPARTTDIDGDYEEEVRDLDDIMQTATAAMKQKRWRL